MWRSLRLGLAAAAVVLLLLALGLVSYLTGDVRSTIVILVMVVLGVLLRFFQEMRADDAAAKLQAMVTNTATVVRNGIDEEVPPHVPAHVQVAPRRRST